MHVHVPCCDSRHHSRSCVNLVFGQPDSDKISQKAFSVHILPRVWFLPVAG